MWPHTPCMTTEWITQSGPGRVGILQKHLNPSNLVLKAGLCDPVWYIPHTIHKNKAGLEFQSGKIWVCHVWMGCLWVLKSCSTSNWGASSLLWLRLWQLGRGNPWVVTWYITHTHTHRHFQFFVHQTKLYKWSQINLTHTLYLFCVSCLVSVQLTV